MYRVEFYSWQGNVETNVEADNEQQAVEKAMDVYWKLRLSESDLKSVVKL